jgi:hypothetical protein
LHDQQQAYCGDHEAPARWCAGKEKAVTEREITDVVEILRARLGVRYVAGLDAGRREINRVVADELRLSGTDADVLVSRLIDAGMIRYVTRDEVDPVGDPEAQDDERSDEASRRSDDYIDRSGSLRANAIAGQGGPSAGTSGQMGGPVAPPAAAGLGPVPVAAVGTGSAVPAPLAAAAMPAPDADGVRGHYDMGYWEFVGERAGVVPSSTRKGQVEPRGT